MPDLDLTAVRWTVAITCPLPPNRTVDDLHTRGDKPTAMARMFFGPGAELDLTHGEVRFRHTAPGFPGDIARWEGWLAMVLKCMFLGESDRVLPRPVRVEIVGEGQ